MSRKLIVWLVVPALAIIVVLLLAGYGMGVRATESRVAAAEITQGSSTVTSGEPVIAVTPLSGGPGTLIAVTGANFPAGATITIQLAGQAAPSPVQTYAVTQAGPSGNFSISFVMPANWPDGTAIPSQTLTVVATRAGSDGTRASAAFGYSSGSTPVATPAEAAATPLPAPATRNVCARDRDTYSHARPNRHGSRSKPEPALRPGHLLPRPR